MADFSGALKILKQLRQHKNAWPFNEPVDPVALNIPDYFQVIQHPMDLGTVETKLNNRQYSTLDDFAADVRQIWENAAKYNGPEHDITKMAHSLSDIFERRFESLRNTDTKTPSSTKKKSVAGGGRPKGKMSAPEMNFEEKRQLCVQINSLEPKSLGKVVQIIHRGMPNIFRGTTPDTEEIEINIDALDANTLRSLEAYVQSLQQE